MRWWAIVWCVLGLVLATQSKRAAGAAVDPQLKARVEKIIAELSDQDQKVRERADVKLRNLPLPAYPLVTAIYGREQEALDPEARRRIEGSIEMFKALAVIDQREQKYWAWMQAHLLQAYDQKSTRNPKWNEPAREAIVLATTWSRDPAQTDRMRDCFAKATEAGCDDGLLLYYYGLFYSTEPGAQDRRTLELLTQAVVGVCDRSDYPDWIRCLVASQAEMLLNRRPELKVGQFSRELPGDYTPSQFFELITPQDGLPDRLLFEMAEMISRQDGNLGAKHWYEQLAKPFALCAADPVYPQIFKAMCDLRHALVVDQIPGRHVAQDQEQLLAAAQTVLEKAYVMDSQLSIIPREMMRILFARGTSREAIDRWFKRAMAVNPDDFEACTLMLEALPTKEKLDFGRQCLAGQNWRGRLPIILVHAHEAVGNAVDDKANYWLHPQVWKDVEQVYKTYLELYPDSVEDRSNFALLANRCGEYAEADRQFDILGDKPSLKVFGSMASYDYQRKKAAKNVVQ